jgi:aminoglycoside phosphotransferase family enzyme/predicted kinase
VSVGVEAEVVAWFTSRSERVVETACARVFLSGETAFKLKRAVDLGYVDFSTPARRLWALERELAFNRAAAPDVYRAIRPVIRTGDGFQIGGEGEPVEYVLEMRRFDDQAVLAARPDRIDGAMAEALGRTIAGFHARAPLRPDGGLSALAFTIRSNAELLRDLKPELGSERVETLIAATDKELARQEPLLAERTRAGFSRHCHGDLHLGNILVENGRPVLFDCIEFNDLLSDLDVQYDLAFLLMDLDFRGRRDAGVRVLSAYLDEAARSFPDALPEGLAALPLMLSVRAGVRAHVSAHSGLAEAARAYVEAGIAHLAPQAPTLTAVGGLSGSGKSSFAREIAPMLGASPGAVVLRTDEIRKRLHGVGPTERLPPGVYTSDQQARVYERFFDEASRLLTAGRAVVLDATFLDPALRQRAEDLAAAAGVGFRGAWMQAPPAVLRARVAGRSGDASDADLATLESQLSRDVGSLTWAPVDAPAAPDVSARAWFSAA